MRLPHLVGPATRPFTFVGCLELREILGRRARDERELMEGLEQIPAGSIYYHTHSIFLRLTAKADPARPAVARRLREMTASGRKP